MNISTYADSSGKYEQKQLDILWMGLRLAVSIESDFFHGHSSLSRNSDYLAIYHF